MKRADLKDLYEDTCEEKLFSAIDNWDEKELVACYTRSPRHSLLRDIPNVKFMKDNFDLKYAETQGVIVGKSFKGESLEWGADTLHKGVYILNRCKGNLNIADRAVLHIYVSNGCDLTINVSSKANAVIDVFGYSKVNITQKADSIVRLKKHQYAQGKIKISK